MSVDHLIHIASASGGILYIMAVVLLIALTVIVERAWYLNRVINKGSTIAHAISSLNHIDQAAIEELSLDAESYPHGALLSVPLRFPGLRDPNRLSELLEESILWQAPRIDRSLWMLDTIVTLAPLLGLLGTIIGMFNAFQILGSAGHAPTQITGGVAEALVATACGLFIAIVGLVCFNGLHNRVRQIIHQMETIKVMLVNRLDAPRSIAKTVPVSSVAREVEAA